MSEVRGSGRECQAVTAQERREELPKSEVNGGRKETPRVRGQWRRPRVATPRLKSGGREKPPRARGQGWRPGVGAGGSNPRSSGFAGRRRA